MFKTYSSSSSLVITSRWFATSRLVAPVSVRLVYCHHVSICAGDGFTWGPINSSRLNDTHVCWWTGPSWVQIMAIWPQTVSWTKADSLSIGPSGTNSSKIFMEIQTFYDMTWSILSKIFIIDLAHKRLSLWYESMSCIWFFIEFQNSKWIDMWSFAVSHFSQVKISRTCLISVTIHQCLHTFKEDPWDTRWEPQISCIFHCIYRGISKWTLAQLNSF